MPRIFRFGEYWIYFWTNEISHLSLFCKLKIRINQHKQGIIVTDLFLYFLHQKAQNVLKIRRVSHYTKKSPEFLYFSKFRGFLTVIT